MIIMLPAADEDVAATARESGAVETKAEAENGPATHSSSATDESKHFMLPPALANVGSRDVATIYGLPARRGGFCGSPSN